LVINPLSVAFFATRAGARMLAVRRAFVAAERQSWRSAPAVAGIVPQPVKGKSRKPRAS
jgi:hypothetical protein